MRLAAVGGQHWRETARAAYTCVIWYRPPLHCAVNRGLPSATKLMTKPDHNWSRMPESHGITRGRSARTSDRCRSPTASSRHPAEPQGVSIKDNSTVLWGFSRSTVTATSIISDSIWGNALQEIWCNDDGDPYGITPLGRAFWILPDNWYTSLQAMRQPVKLDYFRVTPGQNCALAGQIIPFGTVSGGAVFVVHKCA